MKVETLLVCSLFQVLLVVLSFQSTAGIQCACYSCKETNYTCVTDGYCYTSAIRLKDDSVKYLSQCLDKRNFFPPIDPFVCKLPSYHCCSTDFCNRDSKPLPPEPKAQSIQCACDYCELTNYTCVTDGYCIRKTNKLGDGSVKYFHRCLSKEQFFPPSDPFICRDTSYLCCSTDFCNKDSKPVAPEPKGCSFPDLDFPNGIVKYQSQEDVNKAFVDEYYTLQFVCSPRYYRLGPKYIQCIDGDWTDDIPSCAIKECPSPPNIENASFLIKSGANKTPTLGSSTVYTCDFGFELNNPQEDTLRCGLGRKSKTAKWFGELPACKAKMSCPDPGVSKHGSVKGDCCFSGSILHFSCNEGYELVGDEKILCLPMGVWSSERPLCRPLGEHCDLPPPIPHGFVTGDKDGDYFLPEDEAQIECEPGYVSKGSQSVVCEEGGEWDADFEECTKIFCDPPPPLAHGTIPELLSTNSTSFPYDFGISYICDAGYRLVNGDSWRFCKKRGWSGKTPHCEVIQCPDPGTPENGKKVGDSYTIGSKVQFACFPGYDLLGSIERFCMPNGQWSGDIARCDLPSNYCPNPGVPVNGFKSSSNYDLNSKISFHCRSGYIQIGSPVRECLVNHTWSGTETKCQAPFDFDNGPQVGVTLQAKLTEKAEEQRLELQKYREAQKSPRGRMLDLNYPGRIILYFAFDVSGSIGEQNFAESIRFAKAVVEKVGISEDGARAGAVVFSSEAEAEFLPLNFVTTKEVLDALDRIKYKKGGTAASSAIAFIREDIALVSAPQNLGRDNIKYAIFLLTDGRVNMGGDPKEQAELLKKAGVEIYCIGITGDPKMETLYQIASTSKTPNGQEHPNVYILQNYATLSWLVQNITKGSVDYSQCGLGLENVGNNANRGRIIGGEKSKDPWPWMAALYMYTGSIDKPYDLKCGGSIIHRNFILTAAHCMYHKNGTERHKNHVLIKLGLTDINNVSSVQEFEILKKHAHPGYVHGRYFDNDIALLQLSRDIQFNALVRPVCLPPKDLPEDSLLYSPKEFAWATGWGHEGKVSKHGNFAHKKVSQELKEIPLPIQSRDRCSKSVADNGFNVSAAFTDRMFCAGDGQGGNDTCEGDSGGPLMQSQLNQEGFVYWTQVGIVSWGIGCAQENTYGYYTYVQKFIPWIEDTIERALKQKI